MLVSQAVACHPVLKARDLAGDRPRHVREIEAPKSIHRVIRLEQARIRLDHERREGARRVLDIEPREQEIAQGNACEGVQ